MQKSNLPLNILRAGLIAGTMDILSAIIILAGGNAVGTLKFIASGAFGPAALTGGNGMAAWGLLFHYLIALSWTTAYFLLYPKLPFMRWNKWLNAVIYGAIIWSGMNLLILPMTQIARRGFTLPGVLKNMVILMVCIGLPVALLADRFYRKE